MKFPIRPRTLLIAASMLVLGACSAIKLGYNNSVTFAYTYLGSKVDFSDSQSDAIKLGLEEMLQWHRENELPLLARDLQQVQQVLPARNGVVQPVTAQQVQALNQGLRASLRRTADHAAPLVAKNMMSLTAQQVQEVQTALNESNKKYWEERLGTTPALQQEKLAERMEERFENWLGGLNTAQKTRIARWAKEEATHMGERYNNRLERQQQFMTLLKQANSRQIEQKELARSLSVLLNSWQTPANAADKAEQEHYQKVTVELIVDVLNTASASQRDKAAQRAANWAKDFQILASNK